MLSRHITIGPDSRRERVVLNVIAVSGDAVSARLKPREADDLITKLAHARASLKEEVEHEPDARARFDFAIVDPAWRATTARVGGPPDAAGVSLALRHCGYGWLCFVLPPEEAQALGRWLLDHGGRGEEEALPDDARQAS